MGNAECSVLAAMMMAYTRLSKIDPAPLNELTALSSAIKTMEDVEPVGIVTGLSVMNTPRDIDWLAFLPLGTKLYTHPAPAVPDVKSQVIDIIKAYGDARWHEWKGDPTNEHFRSTYMEGMVDAADDILAHVIKEIGGAMPDDTKFDLSKCPGCGGPADNGHDRSYPPSPYYCTKCMNEPAVPEVHEFTCPYCKHEQPYAEIYCHNCNAKYTIDAIEPMENQEQEAEYDRLAEAYEEEKRWSARYRSQRDELAATLRTILSISLMDKGHRAKTIELEVVAALAKLGEQP